VAESSNHRPLLDVEVTPGPEAMVALRGDLDPHTAPLLEAAVREIRSDDGTQRVVIDLGAITFIDSSGLRVFVAARESLASQGIDLALRNPSANTRRLLDITGLGEIITVE
jgi:anti-sigma B factor antagonist